jgi:hypothetical protein
MQTIKDVYHEQRESCFCGAVQFARLAFASRRLSPDLLPFFGAHPVEERVVIDANRITGGGVTAGIDFGLAVAAEVYGSLGEVQGKVPEGQAPIRFHHPEPPF